MKEVEAVTLIDRTMQTMLDIENFYRDSSSPAEQKHLRMAYKNLYDARVNLNHAKGCCDENEVEGLLSEIERGNGDELVALRLREIINSKEIKNG